MAILTRLFHLPRKGSNARGDDSDYVYQPALGDLSFDEAVDALHRKGYSTVLGGVDGESPHIVAEVKARLRGCGITVEDYSIDVASFQNYLLQAQYSERYPSYYAVNLLEKHVEHFVTLDLLALNAGDVFIDIASEDSPVPDIFERVSRARTYAQDIQYKNGIHGRKIGGDACAMPLQDQSITKAALTCSLEHFERDGDSRVLAELARILKSGGIVVVAPLYLSVNDATQTDSLYSAHVDVPFDPGTILHCARDWKNRHGSVLFARNLEATPPRSAFRQSSVPSPVPPKFCQYPDARLFEVCPRRDQTLVRSVLTLGKYDRNGRGKALTNSRDRIGEANAF